MSARRRPIMEADTGRAFSSGASRPGAVTPGSGEKGVEFLPSSAPAPVYFQARAAYGGTGEFVVVSVPSLEVQARFPTLEAAQAYALSLNEWLARRPDPSSVQPFFAPELDDWYRSSWERFRDILDRSLRPETSYAPVSE